MQEVPYANDEFKELSSRAARGEKEALRSLFAVADQYENNGNFEVAAKVFRDSAIVYRISAFRNLNRAEQAEAEINWHRRTTEIFRQWVTRNPRGLGRLPYPANGITTQDIRRFIVDELLNENSFSDVFQFLEVTLESLGMRFYSPGGSLQRRTTALLSEVFGLDDFGMCEYLTNVDVRVCLDLLADEVMRRYENIGGFDTDEVEYSE